MLQTLKSLQMTKLLGLCILASTLALTGTSCNKKHCITFTDANGNDCCEKCFLTQKRLDDFVASNTLNCPDVCD